MSEEDNEARKYKFRATAFIVGVAGVSALIGFSRTLSMSKKSDSQYFDKGIAASSMEMSETGAQLALRALKWGTLLAIIGTGSLCFGVYKLSGAKDLQEFRNICGNILPRIPKNKEPQSRTEFESLSDFMSYVSQWKK